MRIYPARLALAGWALLMVGLLVALGAITDRHIAEPARLLLLVPSAFMCWYGGRAVVTSLRFYRLIFGCRR